MKRGNIVLYGAAAFLILIYLIFALGCSISGGNPPNVSVNDIYPTGTIKTAKILDKFSKEKNVTLNQNDLEFIIKTVKSSNKELLKEYETKDSVELNVALTDSVIQLVRKNSYCLYYVFHRRKINGICYRIYSKELSEFILKLAS